MLNKHINKQTSEATLYIDEPAVVAGVPVALGALGALITINTVILVWCIYQLIKRPVADTREREFLTGYNRWQTGIVAVAGCLVVMSTPLLALGLIPYL